MNEIPLCIFRFIVTLVEIYLSKPILVLLIFLPLTTAMVYRVWSRPEHPPAARKWYTLAFLGFCLADWGLFRLLAALELSYAYERPLVLITLVRSMLFILAPPLLTKMINWFAILRHRAPQNRKPAMQILFVICLLELAAMGVKVYGMFVGPFQLSVSTVPIPSPAFLPNRPLRIVHLTDLHIERYAYLETHTLEIVAELQPDLILLTGDYTNSDYVASSLANSPETYQAVRTFLNGLSAPYGVYGVAGNVEYFTTQPIADTSDTPQITWLENQVARLELPGGDLYLVGVHFSEIGQDPAEMARLMEEVPAGAYSILLYHKPTMIPQAAEAGVNLYLAGHTHGGQIRLPWVGSPFHGDLLGSEEDVGLSVFGGTITYVSRGIGMEGLGLPRIRINCPPEIVLLELSPRAGGK